MDEQPACTPDRIHDLLSEARLAEQEAEGYSAKARMRLQSAERLRSEAHALIRAMLESKRDLERDSA
jgi:hypothetical protein